MNTIRARYDQLLNRFFEQKKGAWTGGPTPQSGMATLTSEIVLLIISEAIISRASDIHIEPLTATKIKVRFRIDGRLYDVIEMDNDQNVNVIARLKILANLPTDPASARKAWDGRFTLEIHKQKFDFRIATFPTLISDKIAIRILNKNAEGVDLRKIGLTSSDLNRLEQIIQRKSGLFIVSGPTGAGKTTTLYSIMRRLHTSAVNIVTLEDPVEYQIDGINQCDIKKKGDENFAAGLKAVLRQDPDIILVGEMRDLESAEIALRASITGHFVLSSLHANSAIGTIMRLINMGLEKHMVAYALVGTMAQRLVRKICDGCRSPQTVDASTLKRICAQCGIDPELFTKDAGAIDKSSVHYLASTSSLDEFTFYKGTGCDQCSGTGYRGRVGIFEIVQFTDELREALVKEEPLHKIEEIATKKGFQPLAHDAILKLRDGLVSIDDIYPILLEKSS